MKYTSEVIVDLPLDGFMAKFDNAENMKHWQKGLVSIEHISGFPGMVGAKMKLNYQFEKNRMSIIETVTHHNLPYEFHGTYSTEGVSNFQQNFFKEMENGSTKWISVSDYMPLNFKMRSMLWLMPKAFKKQSIQYMLDFKNFAEKGISVANATT
ncbi:MAG: SRPBCC family protein [Gelidibacter sp.]